MVTAEAVHILVKAK